MPFKTISIAVDDRAESFNDTPGYMEVFIRNYQDWFNVSVRKRGNLFLNEIYDAFGLPRTKEGATCGWLDSVFGYVDFEDVEIDPKTQFVRFNVAVQTDIHLDL